MSKEKLSKFLLIPNNNNLESFIKYNFNGFVLPLEGFSIGFDTYFSIDEINALALKHNVFVLINKFLHFKDIELIKEKVDKLENISGFFIEDLGLTNVLPKDKIIINQIHMINNYEGIEYLKTLGFNNVTVSNELTINELMEIRDKNIDSKLFYYLINRNNLMYSKRKLLSNYFENFNLKKDEDSYIVTEKVSKKEFVMKEEYLSTVVFDKFVFSANKYIKELKSYDYLIVNINNMNEYEVDVVLNNYRNEYLRDLNIDNYFLDNKIGYKVANNA